MFPAIGTDEPYFLPGHEDNNELNRLYRNNHTGWYYQVTKLQ